MAGSGADPASSAGAAAPQPPLPPRHPLPFRLLPAAPTAWDPATAEVTLNLRLDGCIVPSEASAEGARISYSHAVVIDDFIDDATRQQLLDFLLHGDAAGGSGGEAPQPGSSAADAAAGEASGPQLPAERWERRTTDMAGAAPTWGVKRHVLRELAEGRLPAMQEVHARLQKLYPECDIAHLPSDAIQLQPPAAGQAAGGAEDARQEQLEQQQGSQQQDQQQQPDEQQPGEQQRPAKRSKQEDGGGGYSAPTIQENGGSGSGAGGAAVDCACFVANAAVAGDSFRYHVDADPTSFPDGSPWHAAYGDYFNGEPGRPLLVSLLLYLNPEWRREWGADTLLLDGGTDTGVFVAPRPGRALLFDQDVLHRVSAPLAPAGARPRFSLVWKLALLPRAPGQALCLARPEWGLPTSFGSAARVDAVKRRLAAERRGGGWLHHEAFTLK